jgi:protein gp37
MSKKRKPGQWWDASWTLVEGCTWPEGQEPEGCRKCWARGMAKRFRPEQLEGVTLRRSRLLDPVKCTKATVFACQISYGDLFQEVVPDRFIEAAWEVMESEKGKRHKFVLLTKRPERAAATVRWLHRGADPEPGEFEHIYLLASVWDQQSADKACAELAVLPPGIRWGLHMEPLLGPVDLHLFDCAIPEDHAELRERIAWIVVGAENGPGARPMDPDWARSIRDQCQAAGVPFYLKGLSGKGRELDGREWNEVPW